MRSPNVPRVGLTPPDKSFDLLSLVLTQFNHGYTPLDTKYSPFP